MHTCTTGCKQVLSQEQKYASKLMHSCYKWMQTSTGLTELFPHGKLHVFESFHQKNPTAAQLLWIMRNGCDAPSTLAACLPTSCGPISNPAKNRGLPVDTVPQKVQDTSPAVRCACETAAMANTTHTVLQARLRQMSSLCCASSDLAFWKPAGNLNHGLGLEGKKFKGFQVGLWPDPEECVTGCL